MATADTPEKVSPPYIPWGTFTNFVDRLKTTAIPSTIDNTVMPNLAGGVRGQVRSALRFLRLTNSADQVTDSFRELIQSYGTETWVQVLSSVLDSAYLPVIGDLDVSGATPGQLQSKFRATGTTGQMAEKAIRFFLAAMENAGKPISPHLAVRSSSPGARNARRVGKGRSPAGREREADQDEFSEGVSALSVPSGKVRTFSFPIPGKPDARVAVPEDIEEDQWAMIDLTLRAYVRLNVKGKGRSSTQEETAQ